MTYLADRLMRMMAVMLFVVLASVPALAVEVIERFDSRIKIERDGTMKVTETITVNAEGKKIRRGIFRDFPMLQTNAEGREQRVEFELSSVTRNGSPEPYRVENNRLYKRIYIGDADVFIEKGRHTYQLVYTTGRQIRFFEQRDELFWNVTGNFWDFAILESTAYITLPQRGRVMDTVGYTGRQGSTDQNVRAQLLDGGNTARFDLTKRLRPRAGMTVGVQFAKGIVSPPTAAQTRSWFLGDYRGELLATAGAVAIAVFYLFFWWRIGRDPEPGVIVPRWDAPETISPALANYVEKKGISGRGWDAISAAIISLAVKGHLVLDDLKGDVVLKTTGNTPSGLPVGEAVIHNKVLGQGGDLRLDKENGKTIKSLNADFVSAMEREHRKVYYKKNWLPVLIGAVLSAIAIITAIAFSDLSEALIGALLSAGFALAVLSVFIVQAIRNMLTAHSLLGRIMGLVGLAFPILFATAFGSVGLAATSLDFSRPWLAMALATIVILNALFFFIMGAPTPLGRKIMDDLEGLKTYLKLAEKDRMNLKGAPEMSPQHFERLLPYAVALGVEKPWSKAFDAWLAGAIAAGAVAAGTGINWYRGRNLNPGSIGDTMGGISDSVSSSMASAMPAPKSSSSGFSGGGGGFSGGGGGGGGGGGW